MKSVVVNRRGVICGKLEKAMLCGATEGTGTGRNGRVKLTLAIIGWTLGSRDVRGETAEGEG